MIKKLLLSVLAATILNGCASPTDQQLNFAPTFDTQGNTASSNTVIDLQSRDLRTAQYLAIVKQDEDKALPIHARQNVRLTFHQTMERLLEGQGFNINSSSNNKVEIELIEALTNVKTNSFNNDMNARVTLQVTAETPNGRFTKTYRGKATTSRSLGASNEQIENIMNHVSTLVMNEIAKDVELADYMEKNFQ